MGGDVINPTQPQPTQRQTSYDFKREKQREKKPSSQLFSRWSLRVNYSIKSHLICLLDAYDAFTHMELPCAL